MILFHYKTNISFVHGHVLADSWDKAIEKINEVSKPFLEGLAGKENFKVEVLEQLADDQNPQITKKLIV